MKTQWIPVVTLAILASLSASAWIPAQSLWRWKLSLATLELGHWLSLAALLSGAWLMLGSPRWIGLVGALTGLILTGVLLIPALQAQALTPTFSWAALWTSSGSRDAVMMETTAPGLRLVTFRPKTIAKPLPWIVLFHSGGWEGGDPAEFAEWNLDLAAEGVIILCPAYRLAPQHQWPAPEEDALAVIQWARRQNVELQLDPEQLHLMGRSAGAQIASAAAFRHPEWHVKGLISFYGPSDMHFARTHAYEDDILNSLKLLRQYLGGDPEEVPQSYVTASAIDFIGQNTPPTLLLHGARDTLVWSRQSERLAAALEREGRPVTFLRLPWAVHACDYFPGSPAAQIAKAGVVQFLGMQQPRK